MKSLPEILNIINKHFSQKSLNRFSQMRSDTVEVKALLCRNQCLSGDEVDFIRYHFLNMIDVVCGSKSNSSSISREVSDQKIILTLKSILVAEPDSRYAILTNLPFVGERSAICVLSFFFPNDYAIVNKSNLTLLRITNENFSTIPTHKYLNYSSMILELSRQLNSQSGLNFSLDLLLAVEYIMTRRIRKMPTLLLFEEKLEYKLNSILNETEAESIAA